MKYIHNFDTLSAFTEAYYAIGEFVSCGITFHFIEPDGDSYFWMDDSGNNEAYTNSKLPKVGDHVELALESGPAEGVVEEILGGYFEPWVSYTKISGSSRVDYNHGDNYVIVRSGVWNGSDEPVDIKTTVFKSLTVNCQSVWDAISYKAGSYTEGGLRRDQDIIYIDDVHAGGYNLVPSQENVCDKVGALLDNPDNQFYDVETNTFDESLAGTVFDVRWRVGTQ